MAQIAHMFAQSCDVNGGEVIKNQRHLLLHQKLEQTSDHAIDSILVIHQGLHAAQQVLMALGSHIHPRHEDRLQLTQHTQFVVRVEQAVEDHQANCLLNEHVVTGTAKDTGQSIKAQFMPKLGECSDID